jgi:hypothetical protein
MFVVDVKIPSRQDDCGVWSPERAGPLCLAYEGEARPALYPTTDAAAAVARRYSAIRVRPATAEEERQGVIVD